MGDFIKLKKDIDIQKIYDTQLKRQSETKRKELDKLKDPNEKMYRASSSGMCARKIYYETILKQEPTDKPNEKTMRIFRIGDLIHEDIQNAVVEYFKKKESDL